MSKLRLIADVHISPLTVAALQQESYDIIRSTDRLPPNAADIEILELARVEGRIVLTQDLDFSMLVALNHYEQPSLVTLRLSSAKPILVAQPLQSILPSLESDLKRGVAVTIDDESVRMRQLPIR